MNSSEYIINELNLFITSNQSARARYEYDKEALIHIIEITPNKLYHESEAYIAWEDKLFMSFVELFPQENICFISDDSYISIKNPLFTKEGVFAPYTENNENELTISLPSSSDFTIFSFNALPLDHTSNIEELYLTDCSSAYIYQPNIEYSIAA